MDIFFQDPDEIPLPPDEVRIQRLQVTPWPDGRRVRVYLEVNPFQKSPSADLMILNAQGRVDAQVSILESMTRKMEVNMHLKQVEIGGTYRLRAMVYYPSIETVDLQAGEMMEDGQELPMKRMEVDQKEISFEILSSKE